MKENNFFNYTMHSQKESLNVLSVYGHSPLALIKGYSEKIYINNSRQFFNETVKQIGSI